MPREFRAGVPPHRGVLVPLLRLRELTRTAPAHGVARAARLLTVALLAALSTPLAGCGSGSDADLTLTHRLLLLERDALRRAAADGSERAEPDVLVAIPEGLVESLLRTDLPFERRVDRFVVTATEVDVDFGGTLALLRLGGRVRLASGGDVEADVELVGVLEVLDVDASSGLLKARVDVLGVRTRDVRVGGASPPAERLVDAFAARPVEELNALHRDVEIPVRVLHRIDLPRVDEEEVSIEAASIPVSVAVHRVRVGDGIILVELRVAVPDEPGGAVPDTADASAPASDGERP